MSIIEAVWAIGRENRELIEALDLNCLKGFTDQIERISARAEGITYITVSRRVHSGGGRLPHLCPASLRIAGITVFLCEVLVESR
jgi:hypothetical protein